MAFSKKRDKIARISTLYKALKGGKKIMAGKVFYPQSCNEIHGQSFYQFEDRNLTLDELIKHLDNFVLIDECPNVIVIYPNISSAYSDDIKINYKTDDV